MSNQVKPFGMLFEECAPMLTMSVVPEYDLTESLSFIVDLHGNRIPFISQGWELATTATVTLIQAETSDSDQEQRDLGTQTATRVRSESSDDDTQPSALATVTVTRIKAESADVDSSRLDFSYATQTVTEVRAENTDAD